MSGVADGFAVDGFGTVRFEAEDASGDGVGADFEREGAIAADLPAAALVERPDFAGAAVVVP